MCGVQLGSISKDENHSEKVRLSNLTNVLKYKRLFFKSQSSSVEAIYFVYQCLSARKLSLFLITILGQPYWTIRNDVKKLIVKREYGYTIVNLVPRVR